MRIDKIVEVMSSKMQRLLGATLNTWQGPIQTLDSKLFWARSSLNEFPDEEGITTLFHHVL